MSTIADQVAAEVGRNELAPPAPEHRSDRRPVNHAAIEPASGGLWSLPEVTEAWQVQRSATGWCAQGSDPTRCVGLGRLIPLTRNTIPGKRLLMVGLNPATANAHLDDAPTRRAMGYASTLGAEHLIVVNLFSQRATNPYALGTNGTIEDPDNDLALTMAIDDSNSTPDLVIAAWGSRLPAGFGDHEAKVRARLAAIGARCFGFNSDGRPTHVTRVSSSSTVWLTAVRDGG